LGDGGGLGVEAKPALATARNALQRGVALAPEVNRRVRLLHWLGVLAAGRQGVELVLVFGNRIAPQAAHDLQVGARARRAAGERHLKGAELFFEPADADAEVDTTAR